MKKLLGISLVAVLAATPLMAGAAVTDAAPTSFASNAAEADITAATASTGPKYQLKAANDSTDSNAASAGYVKGAYNAAIKAINNVAETAEGAVQKTSIATSLTDASTDAQVASAKAVYDAIDGINTGVMSVTASDSTEGVIVVDGADVAVKGAVVEGKLDDGATGYDINAKSLKVKGLDAVTVSEAQTLSNKVIDADNNRIENLETDNFKNGVIQTTVRSSTNASDTSIASEKAVATAIEGIGIANYATIAGVDATIKAVNLSTQSGTSTIMTDWANDSSDVSITYLTSAAIDDSSVSYATANPAPANPAPAQAGE